MIAKLNSNGTFQSRKWSCVWRPDVGSSLYARSDWMRAGGVGGVAWMQTGAAQSYSYGTGSGEVHVPLADHMGNVRHYYQFKASGSKVTGQLVASYEYDAFGREVRAWGLNTPATNQPPGLPASRPWADHLPFHYSSKLRDVDSGFNYYGYRFYDPGAGRWLNRDPIGERGGVNLYGMVGNDPVRWVDRLGLDFGPGITDANSLPTPEENRREAEAAEKRHKERNRKNHCPRKEPGSVPFTGPFQHGSVADHTGQGWIKEGFNTYHPARNCYRGTGAYTGSQCCYDNCGDIDNSSPSMGTYDYVPPDGGRINGFSVMAAIGHWFEDVRPHRGADGEYEPTPDANLY